MALTQVPIELSSTPGIVDNSNATAITIDSSENVLVGKTANDNTTAGHRFTASGFTSHVIANDYPLLLNRLSSDGALLTFRKDSTTVGSIGVTGGDILYLTCESHGIKINSDAARIDPSDGSGNSSDGALDLGDSGSRFKDLYLSGGAYLGGTGSANKLDDYEEGTFTPTSGVSLTVNYAKYTKIGRVVYINVDYQVSSGSSSSSMFYNTLPFTPLDAYSAGSFNYQTTTYDDATVNIEPSGVFFRNEPDTPNMTYAQAAGRRFIYSAWYHTNA